MTYLLNILHIGMLWLGCIVTLFRLSIISIWKSDYESILKDLKYFEKI